MKQSSANIIQWLTKPFFSLVTLLREFAVQKENTIQAQQPNVIPSQQHNISTKQFSKPALKVLNALHEAGHEAYLVGGCLRDILTGIKPKDFDVVTNARPEQIDKLFKRSRIIGRRFRLVHVYFGREVIEVATFRTNNSNDDDALRHSDSGRLLRDNVFGSIEDDAVRRDFTINALYYNIADHCLYDFCNALDDIKQGIIRLIGDPETRYREDPVRMLRAARFAAKLNFKLDADTADAIQPLAHLLRQVPPARLFDESNKMFITGHGKASFQQLRKYHLFKQLFPQASEYLENDTYPQCESLFTHALDNTDKRIQLSKPVTPAFLFAVFLWPRAQHLQKQKIKKGMPPAVAMSQASSQTISEQVKSISIPKRFSSMVREMWDLQERLPRRHGARAARLVEHPRFRAAYDFLLLREQAGEIPPGLGEWWTQYQEADAQERRAMVHALNPKKGSRKRKRRPKKAPRNHQDDAK